MKGMERFFSEPESESFGLPPGVLFLHDDELKNLERLCSKITRMFEKASYRKVSPPLFEYYETFEKGSGADIARKTFSFKDKDGKLLSLRYDMTTPIARMAAMLYSHESMPWRFYYCGDVFREQPLHKGKPRQMKQAGIEMIGSAGINSDAEIVGLLGKCLEIFDKDYKIVMGDVGLYRHIISKLLLDGEMLEAVHKLYNKKDAVTLGEIKGEIGGEDKYKELLLGLPYMIGEAPFIFDKLRALDGECRQIIERLESLYSILPVDVKRHIIIDLGLIRDFSYYTGLTLEGYIKNYGFPVVGGGRYDKLFLSWGRDYPAVGFAVDIGPGRFRR